MCIRDSIKTEVLSVEKAAEKLVDLIGADVIVSVGRGISTVSYTHLDVYKRQH